MIDRYVFIKLDQEHATLAGRSEVVDETRTKLANLPGVVGLTVGTPADMVTPSSLMRRVSSAPSPILDPGNTNLAPVIGQA